MPVIIDDARQGVAEYRRRFLKSDAVARVIRGCLGRIPFDGKGHPRKVADGTNPAMRLTPKFSCKARNNRERSELH
jgi:hypothetical protein